MIFWGLLFDIIDHFSSSSCIVVSVQFQWHRCQTIATDFRPFSALTDCFCTFVWYAPSAHNSCDFSGFTDPCKLFGYVNGIDHWDRHMAMIQYCNAIDVVHRRSLECKRPKFNQYFHVDIDWFFVERPATPATFESHYDEKTWVRMRKRRTFNRATSIST